MEEIRKQILKYLEKNSRADLGELAVLMDSDEVTIANEMAQMESEVCEEVSTRPLRAP